MITSPWDVSPGLVQFAASRFSFLIHHISAGGGVSASWLCVLVVGAGTGLLAGLLGPFCALPSCCFLHRIVALVFRKHGIYCNVCVIQKELFL